MSLIRCPSKDITTNIKAEPIHAEPVMPTDCMIADAPSNGAPSMNKGNTKAGSRTDTGAYGPARRIAEQGLHLQSAYSQGCTCGNGCKGLYQAYFHYDFHCYRGQSLPVNAAITSCSGMSTAPTEISKMNSADVKTMSIRIIIFPRRYIYSSLFVVGEFYVVC